MNLIQTKGNYILSFNVLKLDTNVSVIMRQMGVNDEIINSNPKVLQDYKNGKEKAFGFFIGQIMKATKGQANPEMVNNLLKERLNRE